jgi:hypothetical protein
VNDFNPCPLKHPVFANVLFAADVASTLDLSSDESLSSPKSEIHFDAWSLPLGSGLRYVENCLERRYRTDLIRSGLAADFAM